MKKPLCLILAVLMAASMISCVGNTGRDDGEIISRRTESESITETQTESETAKETETEPETETDAPDIIDEIISGMTLEEKVGQLFFARCPAEGFTEKAGSYRFGGYILFANFFDGKSAEEVRADIDSIQSQSEIKLLIGVDEEGGTVTRVSRYPALRYEKFKSPRELYALGGLDLILSDCAEKCSLLSSLGINVNFAPVCDISRSESDFMYYRSLGEDAETTAEYISAVVKCMNENNMGSALKHFPGYGSNGDTHTDIITDTRDYSEFQSSDFLPFIAGIEAGSPCVMVSHNIVNCIDSSSPCSLSAEAHRILREELGFEGVIITDDLSMGAITQYTDGESAAVAAILAGNDMLCCTDYETQYPAVLEAVRNGKISVERIEESVRRVLEWKRAAGLIG